MFEKLKDLFYDFSDTLMSIIIILIMALVISWKLSGAMSIPILNNSNDTPKQIVVENHEDLEVSVSDSQNDNDTESTNTPETDTSNSQENNNQETTSNQAVNTNEVVSVEAVDIKIEIPKGTPGAGIAKILKDKGLIESTQQFIDKVEELKLAPKLRFGTFTIKSNSSIENIIYTITGTSKAN